MKLSEETLAILNNFSGINPSILIRKGSLLRTKSPGNSILAKAEIEEEFPEEFAIYEVSRFLGVLSLFKDPELEFTDDSILINSGSNTVRYVYASPDVIVAAPNKDAKMPSEDIGFELSEDDLEAILKASKVMGVPDISVVGEDGVLKLVAHDVSNKSSDSYAIELDDTDLECSVNFKEENFQFMLDDYKFSISKKGIAKIENDDEDLVYWITAQKNSTFGK